MLSLPFFIARRYLFSKKSHNVINIISIISIVGVAIGTMALIVVLSVFNGLEDLIHSLFNSFDPELKITLVEGKYFSAEGAELQNVRKLNEIDYYCESIEDNVLLKYDQKQYIAKIKGVENQFGKMTGLDSMIVDGEFKLTEKDRSYAIVGQGVAYYLSVGLNFINPLQIYFPKKNKNISFTPENAFTIKNIFPSAIFSVQQEFDTKYVIVPLHFAREVFDAPNQVSSIEIKLKNNIDLVKFQEKIRKILPANYQIQNRLEQHKLLYKIMKSEKWAIFIILSFILMIASFNIIASLTMLIIDKKKDIFNLQSMGASPKLVRKIFLFQGWFISAIGAVAGIMVGALLCWLQIHFGFIRFPDSGTFIINAYPVEMQLLDFLAVLATVIFIGFFTAWYPTRLIAK